MPRLLLAGAIRELAGGLGAVEVAGGTAAEAIAALERSHPALRGWVVDEQGALRRHVKLFRGGRAVPLEAGLSEGDELHIVASISGG